MSIAIPQIVYDCDQCGACCKHLILECDHVDALREPRIVAEARLMDGHGSLPLEQAAWNLNGPLNNRAHPCVFLGDDNRCGIYATRPNVCVSHQAGSEQCQMARDSAKLPPLMGRPATSSMADRIAVIAKDGEDE